ncbi:conserved hypothetical protein [Ricinus communis]|uniref:Uncharacterized protein n=1 Tax=Ricinus communis TaxID=3988 RepID=B9T3R5_RICCO|nr:conserved hypothetical protein [Ricinus communis]
MDKYFNIELHHGGVFIENEVGTYYVGGEMIEIEDFKDNDGVIAMLTCITTGKVIVFIEAENIVEVVDENAGDVGHEEGFVIRGRLHEVIVEGNITKAENADYVLRRNVYVKMLGQNKVNYVTRGAAVTSTPAFTRQATAATSRSRFRVPIEVQPQAMPSSIPPVINNQINSLCSQQSDVTKD